jgi:hypothetical protein
MRDIALAGPKPTPAETTRRLLLLAFLLSTVAVGWRMWSRPEAGQTHWAIRVLLTLAVATTIATQTRELPLQNLLLASSVLGLGGAVAAAFANLAVVEVLDPGLALSTGRADRGSRIAASAMLWLVIVLTARGVTKWLFRPWKRASNYGIWVLSGTMLLVMSLEMTASQLTHLSSAGISPAPSDGAAWFLGHLVAWALMTVVMLLLVTPMLIDKSGIDREANVGPLVIWLSINVLVLTIAVRHRIWGAFSVLAGLILLLGICAIRSRRSGTGPRVSAPNRRSNY